ncbi:MAG: hypothetical protein HYT72_02095 [Candidatus Aenigmarchaeota archaeon]|nr:hypothetical protein [Candidatus Aenigmarchaeota archaeon]
MSEAMELPFGLSWEVVVMLIALGIMAIIIFGNPQFMERIMSFIGGSLR